MNNQQTILHRVYITIDHAMCKEERHINSIDLQDTEDITLRVPVPVDFHVRTRPLLCRIDHDFAPVFWDSAASASARGGSAGLRYAIRRDGEGGIVVVGC
jgi:hypothetical protein